MQKVRHAAKTCSFYWAEVDSHCDYFDLIKETLAYYCYSYAL